MKKFSIVYMQDGKQMVCIVWASNAHNARQIMVGTLAKNCQCSQAEAAKRIVSVDAI